ncbi:hypothetical protein HCJ66_09795 [Listeria sp. FSL L7-1582]|uniref:lipoprotein BA_5634 family protein n=1 Tax=Listeria portnoyi TaxID=2713504 RepID=UPI00164ECA91|nr:lipoprotein BA_5634 family protein [Listeria portnoyi]MBC6309832.1 hypothetical protein [Listeria portnoyi]
MKKLLLISAILGGLLVVLSGCIFDKAEGIVLFGNQEKVQQAIDSNKKNVDSFQIYETKQDKQDDTLTVFLKRSDAKKMQKQQAFTKIISSDKTEALKELPATNGKMLLLAKDTASETSVGGKKVPVIYGGNITFGDTRAYADSIVLVPDDLWDSIHANRESVATVIMKKDAAEYLPDFKDVDRAQLANLEK